MHTCVDVSCAHRTAVNRKMNHANHDGQTATGWTISTASQDNIITVIARGVVGPSTQGPTPSAAGPLFPSVAGPVVSKQVKQAASRIGCAFPFEAGDRAVRQLSMVECL